MRVFEEKQWFNQWWVQLLSISMGLLLAYMLYSWYVLEQPTGNVSASDIDAQLVIIPLLIMSTIILYIFKLSTSIDENGIHYKFFPFHKNKKSIAWNTVKECNVNMYKPLLEYGGWGYKYGVKGTKAMTIKGNHGIFIVLTDNKKILIGTQKPKEAQKVIDRYFNKKQL